MSDKTHRTRRRRPRISDMGRNNSDNEQVNIQPNKRERKHDTLFRGHQQHNEMKNQNIADIQETYGLSKEYLKALGIKLPLNNKVFITNLDFKVDESMLRDTFGLAGVIIRVTILKTQEGNSTGKARVEYDHPVEAVQAVSMYNNQHYHDRQIRVVMESQSISSKKHLPPGLADIGPGLGPEGQPMRGVRNSIELLPLKQMILGLATKETANAGVLNQQSLLDLNALINMNAFNQSVINPLLNPLLTAQHFQTLSGIQTTPAAAVNLVTTMAALQNQNMPGIAQNMSGISQNMQGIAQNMPGIAQNMPGIAQNMPGIAQNMPGIAQNIPEIAQNISAMAQNMLGSSQNMSGNAQSIFHNQNDLQMQSNTTNDIRLMQNISTDYLSESNYSERTSGYDSYREKSMDKNQYNTSYDMENKFKSSDMVVFSNLPSSVTNDALSQKMSEIGDIKFAEFTSKGRAIVRFESIKTAERCVRLFDQSKVDGTTIRVKYL